MDKNSVSIATTSRVVHTPLGPSPEEVPRSPQRSECVLPKPDRLNAGRRRTAKAPVTLKAKDFADQWRRVRGHLQDVAGLDLQHEHRIVAASRPGKEALPSMVAAIYDLLVAGCFGGACKLVRMCRPSVRLDLMESLEDCARFHFESLMSSKDVEVRKSLDASLFTSALDALRFRETLPRFFKLLPYCAAPERRAILLEHFPSPTKAMLQDLDGHQLAEEAVHITRERLLNLDASKCLEELDLLLSNAHDPEDPAWAITMKCILWPVLLQVDDRMSGEKDRSEFAVLLSKVKEENRLPEPEQTIEVLDYVCPGLQGEVLEIANDQAIAEQKTSDVLLGAAITRAIRGMELSKAARLISYISYPTARKEAMERLVETVVEMLEQNGFKAKGMNLISIEKGSAAFPAARVSAAREAALTFITTGEPYYIDVAARILSLVDLPLDVKHEAIQVLLGGLGFAADDLRSQLLNALPVLCSAKPPFDPDVILRMPRGPEVIAQAVVDYLLQDLCDDHTVASLFRVFAHRVDLRSLLAAHVITGPTLAVARDEALHELMAVARQMAKVDLGVLDDCTQHLDQWAPGWRSLLLMKLKPQLFDGDALQILAVNAIDDVAAGGSPGEGELVPLQRFRYPLIQETLAAMLKESVGPRRFLSADAFYNVMQAVVCNLGLTSETLKWIGQLPKPEQQVAWYAELARALIGNLDSTVQEHKLVVRYASGILVRLEGLVVAEQVKSALGVEAWKEILGMRH